MYDAGLRRSEALGLKAESVNLKSRTMMIKGKGDKEATIPITTDRLLGELKKALKKRPKGYLFINPHTGKPWYSIRKALVRAAEKAKLNQRVYHHLLRHSFGTHAVIAGLDIGAIRDIMRHSTVKTTEGYTHLAAKFLSSEATKFNRFVRKGKKRKSRTRPVIKK